MCDDEQRSQNDEKLPSVSDLARQLQAKIKEYAGGMEGVWKQIDGRFKRQEGKSIEGLMEAPENKLSYAAFKKAFQRLGSTEGSAKLEKMRFQIDGNPLLLMNIFEILGISGYKDLLPKDLPQPLFKKPDVTNEIFYINNRLKKISRTLTDINERMEAGHKSINTYKLNADFEEITKRLYSVLLRNEDPLLQDPLYLTGKNNSLNKEFYKILMAKMTGDNTEKTRRIISRNEKKLDALSFFYAVFADFIFNIGGEKKKVVLMAMIFFDYMGYSFNNSLLKEYRRLLNPLDPYSSNFESEFAYILSPFFTIFLYLQITILFITRIDSSCFNMDEGKKEDVLKIIGKETLKTYFLRQLKQLAREIRIILNVFIKNKVRDIPPKNYEIYKDNAVKIIGILKIIFIDNKIDTPGKNASIMTKYKSLKALYKLKNRVYSGTYTIPCNELEKLELVKETILELQQATERDLNG